MAKVTKKAAKRVASSGQPKRKRKIEEVTMADFMTPAQEKKFDAEAKAALAAEKKRR